GKGPQCQCLLFSVESVVVAPVSPPSRCNQQIQAANIRELSRLSQHSSQGGAHSESEPPNAPEHLARFRFNPIHLESSLCQVQTASRNVHRGSPVPGVVARHFHSGITMPFGLQGI